MIIKTARVNCPRGAFLGVVVGETTSHLQVVPSDSMDGSLSFPRHAEWFAKDSLQVSAKVVSTELVQP